jgi:hypothetical protein
MPRLRRSPHKVRVSFEVSPDGGLLPQRVEEVKALLRELALDDRVEGISGE